MITFGPGKNSEESQKPSGGGTAPLFLVGLVTFILAPLAVIGLVVCMIIGERRRVRLSRWAGGAAVATLGVFASTGFSISRWVHWLGAAPSLLWGGWVPQGWAVPILSGWAHRNATESVGVLLAQHMATAVPITLSVMTLWWWWRSYELRLRGEHEGDAYSNRRPVGYLDRWRRKRNTTAVRSGDWGEKNPDYVAVGIGTYGEVADVAMDDLKKAVFISGTSRSGKTRQANSLAAQQVVRLQSANITIDFKGDDDLAQQKAELARQQGVPFLHFKPAPPTGGGYEPPHPYAPDRPAHYDALQRGNGSSKAAMLLNSVPREGDAAVYGRKADEAVKLAYDIAALTGFDRQRIRNGRADSTGHPIGGMQVLSQMLDQDMLIQQGKSVTIDLVRKANPFLSEGAAAQKVQSIHHRIAELEKDLGNPRSTLSGALEDVRSTVASFSNDSAAGPLLNPGTVAALRIDLVRAILRNEVVVFSLSAQDYPQMSSMIGTMVLLDLQNAVSLLRQRRDLLEQMYDNAGQSRPGGTDGTPWNPWVLQIEELGSIGSTAGYHALMGLLNKSADVGCRPIISSQSMVDTEAATGSDHFLRQMLAQVDQLMTLQLSEAQDAERVADFSGVVRKKFATEQRGVDSNRTGLFQRSDEAGRIISREEEATRIGKGDALALDRDNQEFLWVTKTPKLSAVHTTDPEGPNNWAETLTLTPVHEPEKDWNSHADAEFAAQAAEHRNEVFSRLLDDLRTNPHLNQVLDSRREAVEVEQDARPAVTPPPEPVAADSAGPTPASTDPFSAGEGAVPGSGAPQQQAEGETDDPLFPSPSAAGEDGETELFAADDDDYDPFR